MAPYHQAPLPVSNPTTSYWLSQPHPHFDRFRSSPELPTYADTVIIGSGITGALIAHELLARPSEGQNESLLMLEARSICSGASGRNGGHIKPDCYKNFLSYRERFGIKEAKSLCSFELSNMRATVDFIREQGLSEACDLVETKAVDVYMSDDAWRKAMSSFEALKEAGGDVSVITSYEKADAQQNFHFSGIHGAVSYPACSLWPHKLVVGVIEKAIDNGLQLFTDTPVLQVLPVGQGHSTGRWLLETPQGIVNCRRVFHATNGYISNLVPDFASKVVPLKGHVVALQPNERYLTRPMGHTAGIQWGEDFDYMIQRPTDGKPLIYGGRDLAHPRQLLGPIGDADDSTVAPEIVAALQEFPAQHMTGWTSKKSSLRYAWSGIMGLTADELPFVGELPGRPGQFTAAGYSGHGMARVYLTVKALVQLALHEPVDDRVPREYLEMEKRLDSRDEKWESILHQTKVDVHMPKL